MFKENISRPVNLGLQLKDPSLLSKSQIVPLSAKRKPKENKQIDKPKTK